MKFLLVLFFVVGCALAHSVNRRDAADQTAEIKEQHLNIHPDGNFDYSYATGNGIQANAEGSPKQLPGSNPPEIAEAIQGAYSYISPEGKTVNVQYTADENGYRPKVQTN